MARREQELMKHSKRSGGHLKTRRGKEFRKEKQKMKQRSIKLGQIDTSIKSKKFED